jgi:TatD DNase family protein
MLIDSHAHLEMNAFDRDRDQVLKRALGSGIEAIVTVGIGIEECRKAIALAEAYDFVYAIAGVHPHNAREINDGTYAALREFAGHPKVVAFGEIGLDFCKRYSPVEVQTKRFRELIRLAQELSLPVVVHDRDAHEETFSILKEEEAFTLGGVIHCFSGDLTLASRYLEVGFFVSVPGTVTFKNAGTLREVVKGIPLKRLLVETDCPFLAPVPYRGKRNEPSYVRHVAEKIAEVKGIPVEEVAEVTTRNARSLFRLPSPGRDSS